MLDIFKMPDAQDPIGVSNILINDQQEFKTSIDVYTNQLIRTYLS